MKFEVRGEVKGTMYYLSKPIRKNVVVPLGIYSLHNGRIYSNKWNSYAIPADSCNRSVFKIEE